MLLVYFSSQSFWALVMLGLLVLLALVLGIQAHRGRAQGGNEELPGMLGEVTEASDARGRGWALVRGEIWQIHSGQLFSIGDSVRVRSAHGLILEVERVADPDASLGEFS